MIMGGGSSNRLVLQILLAFLFCYCYCYYCCSGEDDGSTPTTVPCTGTEREALLDFKRGLRNPDNRLSSWVGEDCCRWEGVRCSNRTGHVLRLDLRNPRPHDYNGSLRGEIRPSLLGLTHLAYLDLSCNFLNWSRIPSFMGSFRRLRYLNLSRAGFIGEVPPELGNLSRLTHLDLSHSWHHRSNALSVDDAQWISGLTSLQHLDLSNVNFSKASNWLRPLNMLPSVHDIILSECFLTTDSFLSLHRVNFTFLTRLDLFANGLNSTLPDWLFSLRGLQYIDLSFNKLSGSIPSAIGELKNLYSLHLRINRFSGPIPSAIGELRNLSSLDISSNDLSGPIPSAIGELKQLLSLYLYSNSLCGPIPASLGRLSSLQYLDISSNNLNGTVPESMGGLSNLTHLDLSNNSLAGVLTEAHFTNLARLIDLLMANNPQLAMNVGPDWDPPFQLKTVLMDSCKLGPRFPTWLRRQENLTILLASNSGISDAMPEWFWNWSTQVMVFDLSNNDISGKVQFLPSNATVVVDLSNNLFYGPIPYNIRENLPNLEALFLSLNNMNGTIPHSICKMRQLFILDLSKNHFSGEAPDCWDSYSALGVLDFSNNNLSGGIPGSVCSSSMLTSLHLWNNNLSGNIPLSMRNCNMMQILDVAYNMLSGSIPTWLGKNLSSLSIISLRSNIFSGHIPPQLSHLTALRILDLAHNNFSGTIPKSFCNFSAMMTTNQFVYLFVGGYEENMLLDTRGRELEYNEYVLQFVVSIDLSDNCLYGDIPEELGNLFELQSLNLSENHLTGHITTKIGSLKQLESLDLSRNKLSGEIPSSLSMLNFLAQLNLSYNNLSGRIPSGDQLQSLNDPSIYIGNQDLCGFPLIKKCQDDETPQVPVPIYGGEHHEDEDEGESEMQWFYSGLAPGFAVGILTVWGVLVFKKTWRVVFFRFTENIYDKIYVVVAVGMAKLNRKLSDTNQIRDKG